jgi:hypothetical protein
MPGFPVLGLVPSRSADGLDVFVLLPAAPAEVPDRGVIEGELVGFSFEGRVSRRTLDGILTWATARSALCIATSSVKRSANVSNDELRGALVDRILPALATAAAAREPRGVDRLPWLLTHLVAHVFGSARAIPRPLFAAFACAIDHSLGLGDAISTTQNLRCLDNLLDATKDPAFAAEVVPTWSSGLQLLRLIAAPRRGPATEEARIELCRTLAATRSARYDTALAQLRERTRHDQRTPLWRDFVESLPGSVAP